MQTLRRRISVGRVPATVAAALSLTLAGSIAGLVGAISVQALAGAAVPTVTDAVYILSSRGVQVGFGLFALGYIYWTGEWDRYARFRWPTLADTGWIVVAFVALFAIGEIATVLIETLGLPTSASVGTSDQGYGLETPSLLWPLAFVAWFGVAAPAEELFYRGIVQTRLRAALPPVAVVVVAAGCFALSHALFSALSMASGATILATLVQLFAAGLVFCGLYERTDNLVPVALFHGLTWLDPVHTLEEVIVSLL